MSDEPIPTEEPTDLPEPSATSPPPPMSTKIIRGSVPTEAWRQAISRPRRQSSIPLPGQSAEDKGLDMSGYTRAMKDLKRVKITDELKEAYCDRLAVHGKKMIAAVEVGLHYTTIRNHAKMDPSFQEDIDTALTTRSQSITNRLEEDALEGHVKLTYDKETGALVAEEIKLETPLRMALLKRHDPEYRDKSEVDVNVRGGVLVVPGRLTAESWEALFSPKVDATQGEE